MALTLLLWMFIGLVLPTCAYPGRKLASRQEPPSDAVRANAIREAFQISWRGYYEHAFPNDNLHPVTNGFDNDRNGWGVTAVDSLSTAIILEDSAIVQQILELISDINFTTTTIVNETISVFETNIRYLGGLISGYDLLAGPYSHLVEDTLLVDALLKQAVVLADSLAVAFDTPSGFPDPTIRLNPEPVIQGSVSNNIAEAGTLVLEWTRLSDLTGNPVYAELTQRAESYMLHPTGSEEAFPGLVGTFVAIENGSFIDSNGGWSGYTDSFYEYLIKMYLYDPDAFAEYRDRWVLAADSTIEYLASHPTTRPDLTFLSLYNGQETIPASAHLASFAGGNFILGGILLGEQRYIDFGITLTESYYETYRQTASGIGPEGFRWVDSALPNGGNNSPPPEEDEVFYEEAGFWATSPVYILRPETIESLYYAYRVTGDSKYRDLAWVAFNHIRVACRVGSGYGGLVDVTAEDSGNIDQMQSFWLAETIKYLYLIFAEDSAVQVQVDGPNEFVYNTEAHPVRVRGQSFDK
ncbi:hypothetical protein S40285_06897 [Stachybotrys chlorohalonatus IBT 40285]|uniref:alpha-1,2-Mannosidase n=1 Tax=Stachybotrys chlorohalonatus (strain IBT 40285) TaxID=1283841 RepID=A0A084Q966_STAC4|nr:hypothetical protein S40285_06897 [Stachybotrys chlorohalonata IBT 40285]